MSAPCEYYNSQMQAFIESECRLPRNQWIYKIIRNELDDTDESVFIDHPEWCLCLDKHRLLPCPPPRAPACPCFCSLPVC